MIGGESEEASSPLERQENWLEQGDVFQRLPFATLTPDETGWATTRNWGPGLLINHGCALDKRGKDNRPRVERLTFLPLTLTAAINADAVRQLRAERENLQPYEALYLGELPTLGECLVVMSDPVSVPASYFAPTLVEVGRNSDGRADMRLVPSQYDTRCGRVSEDLVALFHAKWTAYWTRLDITRTSA